MPVFSFAEFRIFISSCSSKDQSRFKLPIGGSGTGCSGTGCSGIRQNPEPKKEFWPIPLPSIGPIYAYRSIGIS